MMKYIRTVGAVSMFVGSAAYLLMIVLHLLGVVDAFTPPTQDTMYGLAGYAGAGLLILLVGCIGFLWEGN